MPRPPRTAEEIETMRERILDAAHEAIHERGPHAATIRHIAERLGVSHMTLYNYFPNREAIMQALSERHFAHLVAREQEQLRRARAGEVAQVLREELAEFVAISHRRPEMYRMILSHLMSGEAHCGMAAPRELERHRLRHLAELIRIGIDQGVFVDRDPEEAAHVISALQHGSLVLQVSNQAAGEESPQSVLREVLDLALNYLTRRE